jgi:hypothetical protein
VDSAINDDDDDDDDKSTMESRCSNRFWPIGHT